MNTKLLFELLGEILSRKYQADVTVKPAGGNDEKGKSEDHRIA